MLNQQVTLTVDSRFEFRFFVFSPFSDEIIISLQNPAGNEVPLRPISVCACI